MDNVEKQDARDPSEVTTSPDTQEDAVPALESEAPSDPWQEEWQALQDRHLRLAAEFENYKKRTARGEQDRARTAQADLLADLLEIADNFERALAAEHDDSPYARGVALIRDQLESFLVRRGVEKMQVVGRKFDPELHEALLTMSSEVPSGHVCQELRSGYLLGGRTLRPAQVAVSSGQDQESGAVQTTEENKREK